MKSVSTTSRKGSIVDSWFDRHLAELMSRCNAYFHFLPAIEREEAVAETLASVYMYTLRSAGRGKLRNLTPYTLVLFFGKLCRAGRRMAGFKSTDAMSEAALRRGHHQVHSLGEAIPIRTDVGRRVAPLWQILADRREDSPLENVRKEIDYTEILQKEKVGAKGRRVLEFLCENHGQGSQKELAGELGVSPGRVTQIKGELAACLTRHGYGPRAAA